MQSKILDVRNTHAIKIYVLILYTGQACMELSKEKSSLKQAESQTHQFLKTLGQLESKLSEQINYLTQVSTGTEYIFTLQYLYFQHIYNNVYYRSTARRFWICQSESITNGMA